MRKNKVVCKGLRYQTDVKGDVKATFPNELNKREYQSLINAVLEVKFFKKSFINIF